MNIINFSSKKNLASNSIDKYVAFLCTDTYVSADHPILYTRYNELERDYPYNKYLSTIEELMNRGISILMVPLKFANNTRSYLKVTASIKYKFRTKTYNAPITLIISKYLTYYKYTIISRNYSEEFYVTYKESECTDDIILYKDLGEYSNLLYFDESLHGTSLPLSAGTYEFTVPDETTYTNIHDMLIDSVKDLTDTDWYPDFIIVDSDMYNQSTDGTIFNDLLNSQFSQLIIMTPSNDNSTTSKFVDIKDNRVMLLNNSKYYYNDKEMTLLVPYLDMMLNRGNYQEYISNPSRYNSNDNSTNIIINGLEYDSVSKYFIKGIEDATSYDSYFIIRYYVSRFSRLITRDPSFLRGAPEYIRMRFIEDIISKMLLYNNIISIEAEDYKTSNNKLDMSFRMTVDYLINKTIDFNITFNIA